MTLTTETPGVSFWLGKMVQKFIPTYGWVGFELAPHWASIKKNVCQRDASVLTTFSMAKVEASGMTGTFEDPRACKVSGMPRGNSETDGKNAENQASTSLYR